MKTNNRPLSKIEVIDKQVTYNTNAKKTNGRKFVVRHGLCASVPRGQYTRSLS